MSETNGKPEHRRNGPEAERKLPRSGLAKEVLEQGERVSDSDDSGAASLTPVGSAPASYTGPDRLLLFADSLDEGGSDEQRRAREELETWVTFELAGELFALPVSHVQEILRVSTITHVPHAPHPVRGVTNKRGRVLPVVDLRRRLGLEEGEIKRRSRILVVEARGRLLGLLVDAVQQVVRLARSAMQAPPPDVMTAQSAYILGVIELAETLAILLDINQILSIKEPVGTAAG